MKPLLPGALELPNDKYRFRIDELEKEISRYADENARYADENARLKKRISELEHRQLPIQPENSHFIELQSEPVFRHYSETFNKTLPKMSYFTSPGWYYDWRV